MVCKLRHKTWIVYFLDIYINKIIASSSMLREQIKNMIKASQHSFLTKPHFVYVQNTIWQPNFSCDFIASIFIVIKQITNKVIKILSCFIIITKLLPYECPRNDFPLQNSSLFIALGFSFDHLIIEFFVLTKNFMYF